MMASIALAPLVGVVAACATLGVARATFYRAQLPLPCPLVRQPRTPSPWALSGAEQQEVLAGCDGEDLTLHKDVLVQAPVVRH